MPYFGPSGSEIRPGEDLPAIQFVHATCGRSLTSECLKIKASAGTGRRGRPTKGKTSLKDAVLSIIRANGGKIETNEIINHLKKMGFDISAKSIGVMIQHSLRALAEEGLISRAERGFASITVKGSNAVAVIEPASAPDASVSISAA